jgi:hypothetical protein
VSKTKDYIAPEWNEHFPDTPYVRTAVGIGDNDDDCADPNLGGGKAVELNS